MTIVSKWEDPTEICCDDCGFIYQHDEDDLSGALHELKNINWSITCHIGRDDSKIWKHHCGECNGRNAVNPRGRAGRPLTRPPA